MLRIRAAPAHSRMTSNPANGRTVRHRVRLQSPPNATIDTGDPSLLSLCPGVTRRWSSILWGVIFRLERLRGAMAGIDTRRRPDSYASPGPGDALPVASARPALPNRARAFGVHAYVGGTLIGRSWRWPRSWLSSFCRRGCAGRTTRRAAPGRRRRANRASARTRPRTSW